MEWYATGGMRWSAIKEDQDGVRIHSWSPADVCQLIQQHGQPYHPDWPTQHVDTSQELEQTQNINRQLGVVDRRTRAETFIRQIGEITIYIPSSGKDTSYSTFSWGPPPADQLLSPQTWSEMLGEINHQWKVRADKLELKCDASCPISAKGLLDALLLEHTQNHLNQLLVAKERGLRQVNIYNDKIEIDGELLEWSMRYKAQQRVAKITFPDLSGSICPGDEALMKQSFEGNR